MRPTFAVPGAGYSQSDERRYRDDVAAAFARVMWSNEDTGVPVLSVFGRGGDVAAALGDYDASKISPGVFPSGTFTFPSGLTLGGNLIKDGVALLSRDASYLYLSRADGAYTGIHLGAAGDSNYFTAPTHVFRDGTGVTYAIFRADAIFPQVDNAVDLGFFNQRWQDGWFTSGVHAGAFTPDVNQAVSVAGSIYKTAINGITIFPPAGTSFDFVLANSAGNTVFVVPTLTTDLQLNGALRFMTDSANSLGFSSAAGRPSKLFLGTAGEVWVNAVKVLGARQTGWAAATGTATRTTFATSTVTTAQLAERVKALLDDLISHGVIGA